MYFASVFEQPYSYKLICTGDLLKKFKFKLFFVIYQPNSLLHIVTSLLAHTIRGRILLLQALCPIVILLQAE